MDTVSNQKSLDTAIDFKRVNRLSIDEISYLTLYQNAPDYFYSPDTSFSLDKWNYGVVFKPIVDHFEQKLTQAFEQLHTVQFDLAKIRTNCLSSLLEKLSDTAARTLTLQLHIEKLQGNLAGDTSEQRFLSFLQIIANRDFALQLTEEYPELFRLVYKISENWFESCSLMMSRLDADCAYIQESFFANKSKPLSLASVKFDLGDTHFGGKTVAMLYFEGGSQIVYKPRSIETDVFFNKVIEFLNTHQLSHPLSTLHVLPRKDYGWTEFIASESLSLNSDAAEYYYRFGSLTAILYILGAGDLHSENLIATGNSPMIIDSEVLFMPEIEGQLKYSLLSSGLLPFVTRSKDGTLATDDSALSAQSGAKTQENMFTLNNHRTDEARWDMLPVYLNKTDNRPHFQRKAITYEAHIDSIIAGFKEVYALLKSHYDSFELILVKGTLDNAVQCRFLLRDTMFYSQLLTASVHPDLLISKNKRRAYLLNQLNKHTTNSLKDADHLECEINCLLDGDIPAFHSNPQTLQLMEQQEVVTSNYFYQTGLDLVFSRMKGIKENQLEHELWLLTCCLTQNLEHYESELVHKMTPTWPADESLSIEQASLQAAKNIGDAIVNTALISDSKVEWLGYDYQGGDWTVSILEWNLYEGKMGIALFLALLGHVTKNATYTQVAEGCFDAIIRQAEKGELFDSTGFSGWGGYLYSLSQLSKIWPEACLEPAIEKALLTARNAIKEDANHDFLGGNAGLIMGVLSLCENHIQEQLALVVAKEAGAELLNAFKQNGTASGWRTSMQEDMLTGYSHGNAGIAHALAKLGKWTQDTQFLHVARDAINAENSLFCDNEQNWADLRNAHGSFANHWCHGASGIGLSRAYINQYLDDRPYQKDIDAAVHQILNTSAGRSYTICHGVMGNLDILHSIAHTTGNKSLQQIVNQELSNATQNLPAEGWYVGLGAHKLQPGLMVGVAGIGWALLKHLYPNDIPNLLAMEGPVAK